jgi:hypothetical protein
MKRLALISTAIALLAIGFIAGSLYWHRQAPPSPAPLITPVGELGPGDRMITFPEEVEGTPDPNPQLTVIAKIRNKATGQPVVVARVILGGEVIAKGASEFGFVLPGEQPDYIFLEVQALGYKEWEVGFRHHLSHSRTYPLLVELEPMPTRPAPQA